MVTLTGGANLTTTTNSKGGYIFGNCFDLILGFTSDDLNLIMPGRDTVTPSKTGNNFSPLSTDVSVTVECYGPLASDFAWPVGRVDFLPNEEGCVNIQGSRSDYVTGNVAATMLGESVTIPGSVVRTVSIEQSGCNVDWFITDTDVHYTRAGNVQGNVVYLSGKFVNGSWLENMLEEGFASGGLDVDVVFSTNTHNGQGTIYWDTITYFGSGNLSGTITYLGQTFPVSVSAPENSNLTRTYNLPSTTFENKYIVNSAPPKNLTVDVLLEILKRKVKNAAN